MKRTEKHNSNRLETNHGRTTTMDTDHNTLNSGDKPGSEQLTMSKQDNKLNMDCVKSTQANAQELRKGESGETQPTPLCSNNEVSYDIAPIGLAVDRTLGPNNYYLRYRGETYVGVMTSELLFALELTEENTTPKTEEASNE